MEIENKTIIDHIEGLWVEGKPFEDPSNEYFSLLSLRDGLDYLNKFAKECDKKCLSQLEPKQEHFFFGNFSQEVQGIPNQLLNCAFHWYSISACQYVKAVGTIAYRQDKSRPEPNQYLDSVIPEVRIFRDKVAAHFAWLTKNEHDNEAERMASIMPQLSFWKDSYHVQAFTVTVKSRGKVCSSKKMTPWSIVKIHERLRKRYWPEAQ